MVERQAYLFLLNFVGASCQRLFMVSVFPRHDHTQASLVLLIWFNENVLFSFLEKCVSSPWPYASELGIAHLA